MFKMRHITCTLCVLIRGRPAHSMHSAPLSGPDGNRPPELSILVIKSVRPAKIAGSSDSEIKSVYRIDSCIFLESIRGQISSFCYITSAMQARDVSIASTSSFQTQLSNAASYTAARGSKRPSETTSRTPISAPDLRTSFPAPAESSEPPPKRVRKTKGKETPDSASTGARDWDNDGIGYRSSLYWIIEWITESTNWSDFKRGTAAKSKDIMAKECSESVSRQSGV